MLSEDIYKALRMLTLMIPEVSRSATLLYTYDTDMPKVLLGMHDEDDPEQVKAHEIVSLPRAEEISKAANLMVYVGQLKPRPWDLRDTLRILRSGYMCTHIPCSSMLRGLLRYMSEALLSDDTVKEIETDNNGIYLLAKLMNVPVEEVTAMMTSSDQLCNAPSHSSVRRNAGRFASSHISLQDIQEAPNVQRMYMSLAEEPVTVLAWVHLHRLNIMVIRERGTEAYKAALDTILNANALSDVFSAYKGTSYMQACVPVAQPWNDWSGLFSHSILKSPRMFVELDAHMVPNRDAPSILYSDDENMARYSVAHFLRTADACGLPVDDIWNPLVDSQLE